MKNTKVFIVLQDTQDARPFISAFEQENPQANFDYQPGMVRIESDSGLGITQAVVADFSGDDIELQSLHLVLVSLSGYVDEDDEYFRLGWG
jgi:phenol hydroxylase P2 protein